MTRTATDERYLSRSAQAARYGRSKRSVDRWGKNPALGMPPEMDINGHKFRSLSALERWERSRAAMSIKPSK
jgi:hypothetical protein